MVEEDQEHMIDEPPEHSPGAASTSAPAIHEQSRAMCDWRYSVGTLILTHAAVGAALFLVQQAAQVAGTFDVAIGRV